MQPFEPSFAVTGVDSMLWPRAAEATVDSAQLASDDETRDEMDTQAK